MPSIGEIFGSMFGGQPIDQRTRQGVAAANFQNANTARLQQEYGNAQNDPNYGLSDPGTSALMEQKIINDTMGATGAGGAGQSGYERNQVANAVANFRLQQAAQRQQALNGLRQAMVSSSQGPQPQMGAPSASPLQSFVGNVTRGAAGAVNRGLFNTPDDENAAINNRNAQQPGGAPGTTGFRNYPGQNDQTGGMGVNPWQGGWG